MKALLKIFAGLIWLVKWFLKKRDANEPQRTIEQARRDSASNNDAALNADLDAARDRMQNNDPRR